MNRLCIALFLVIFLILTSIPIYANELSKENIGHSVTTEWTVIDAILPKPATVEKKTPHMFGGHDFEQSERAPADDKLTFTVIIEPKDIESLALSAIDPKSPNFQKQYTAEEMETLRANPEGSEKVSEYFQGHGFEIKQLSTNGGYLSITGPTRNWEKALNTQFFVYKSKRNPKNAIIRTKEYSIPSNIAPHVQEVLNAVEFPVPIGGFAMTKRQEAIRVKREADFKIQQAKSNLLDGTPSMPPIITLSPATLISPIKKEK